MPSYLCCISSLAGIPIICKKKGDIPNLPFPIQAALNGSYMFGKSFDLSLLSLETASCQITWRSFKESVTVILISECSVAGAGHLDSLLDLVWDAMVFCVGRDALKDMTNVEKVKRQLKGCYRLLDRLLDGLEEGVDTFCDITGLPDVLLLPAPGKLQTALELVTESADSTYGCLLVHGRLAAATANWHQLAAADQSLLALYVRSARGSAAARDVSVFLPVKSPHVPFRLLVCRLSENSEMCVLCGPSPALEELERETVRQWGPVLETLRQQEVALPRGFPAGLQLDPAVQSFLLESAVSQRCASSCSPHRGAAERPAAAATAAAAQLRAFYRQTTAGLLARPGRTGGAAEPTLDSRETYLITDELHCYALRAGPYTIHAVFQRGTPPHVMRGLTQTTLQLLTSIKQVRF